MYKYKIFNMEYERGLMISLNSNKNKMWLNQGQHKDSKSCLNHQGIKEKVTLKDINNIKTNITSKFKEKLWHDNEKENKIKLRY